MADSVYGNDSVFRAGLDALELLYVLHVNPSHLVSLPSVKLLPPPPHQALFGAWTSIYSAVLCQGA
ncbi:transposase [Granulosicoccus antarcticus]|uniref:transposase n=1 Tax=Granulosicoccus antarcticus TaxID=437505 RepID=UPI0012FD6F9F